MSTRIKDDSMSLEIDGRVIVAADCCEHAAADGQGAWIISSYPDRLFIRNQAITAMVLAARLATGRRGPAPGQATAKSLDDLHVFTPGAPPDAAESRFEPATP